MGWQCDACTLENSSSVNSCKACGLPRSKFAKRSDRWDCPKCTYINRETRTDCKMCNTKKATPPNERNVDREDIPGTSGARATNDVTPEIPLEGAAWLTRNTSSMKDNRLNEEKEARVESDDIVQFCKVNGQSFVDDSFPPATKSLFFNTNILRDKDKKDIQWLRPSEIRSIQGEENIAWTVFRTPMPSDISQGELGNCWFLSALAVVAEVPSLIENIFVTKKYCPEGVYQVRLCKNGLWTSLILDDLLPCDRNKKLIYSRARRKQLWVPLVEKAFAKLHGSYQSLTAGIIVEGLSALTGAPCEVICMNRPDQHMDADMLWAKLLSYRASGFLMGSSCGAGASEDNPGAYEAVGLQMDHAYSVLDVKNAGENRLIRLRNPWGRNSWNGKWSDNNDCWESIPPDERDQFMAYGANEGVFWMALEDFMRYFNSIEICKYNPDWMEVRFQGEFPSHSNAPVDVMTLEVFETTEVEFGLFQQRTREQEQSATKLLCAGILVFENKDLVSVGTLVAKSRHLSKCFAGFNTMLKPGKYTLLCTSFSHWDTNASASNFPSYVMSVHSSKALLVEQLKVPSTLQTDAMVQLAISKGRLYDQNGVKVYVLTKDFDGMITVVDNTHSDLYAHFKFDSSESTNVISTRGHLTTRDVIPPLHRQVVIILSKKKRGEGVKIGLKFSFQLYQVSKGFGKTGKGKRHDPEIGLHNSVLHEPRPL